MAKTVSDTIGFSIFRTAQSLRLNLERRLAVHGYQITPEQWAVLFGTARFPGESQQRIAREIYKDKASVTQIIVGLEKKGLIRRERDANDRRTNRLFLTPAGVRTEKKVSSLIMSTLAENLSGIPVRGIETAKHVLDTIYKKIKQ